jgi:hypothetical protein
LSRSSRGVSGDDPEGGVRCGVPRLRLVTAVFGRHGTRPPGTCMGLLVSRSILVPSPCSTLAAISSSRPVTWLAAARSGGQGWPQAIAKRLALDGREHSGRLGWSGLPSCSWTTDHDSEGACHHARSSAANLYSVDPVGSHHDAVIRISGEAPGGGPILRRGL